MAPALRRDGLGQTPARNGSVRPGRAALNRRARVSDSGSKTASGRYGQGAGSRRAGVRGEGRQAGGQAEQRETKDYRFNQGSDRAEERITSKVARMTT